MLLAHRGVAIAVLTFVVLGSFASQVTNIITFWKTVFPRTTLLIRPTSAAYVTTTAAVATISLEIILDSSRTTVADDIALTLTYEAKDDNRQFERLSREDVLSRFSVDPKSLLVAAVDTKAGRVAHTLPLRALSAGHYRVTIAGSSEKAGLRSEATVRLRVLPRYVECLRRDARESRSPVFVLEQDDVIDFSPRHVWGMAEFKILLPDEADRTNPVRAALWFTPGYLGVGGGPGFDVHRDTSNYKQVRASIDAVCEGYSYIPYLLRSSRQAERLEHVTFVGTASGPAIVAIGSSVYALRLIDAHRLQVTMVETNVCRAIPATEVRRIENPPEVIYEWKIGSLTATSGYSSGATGRNLASWIRIAGHHGFEIESIEGHFSDAGSDFPLVIAADGRSLADSARFLMIDRPTDLRVRECRTHLE